MGMTILSRNYKTKLTTFLLFDSALLKRTYNATTFADVDVEVIAVQSPPTDVEILAELLEKEGVSNDDDLPVKLLMNQ